MTIEDAVLDYYRRGMSQRLAQLDGDALQDFFADVMELAYPDFVRVTAWGNVGDLKCDGYRQNDRTVFQVYAPIRHGNSKTNAKVKRDFEGACQHWRDHMDVWIFVNNEAETPAPVLNHFQTLTVPNGITTELWGSNRIIDLVSSLTPAQLTNLLGPPASLPGHSTVAFADVQVVLRHLSSQLEQQANGIPADIDLREPPPEKLDESDLSAVRRQEIVRSLAHAKTVERAMQNVVDPQQADRIVAGFRAHYQDLRDAGRFTPDEIYDRLRHFAGGWARGEPAHEQAINAVIAHLFEMCSIFERPAKT